MFAAMFMPIAMPQPLPLTIGGEVTPAQTAASPSVPGPAMSGNPALPFDAGLGLSVSGTAQPAVLNLGVTAAASPATGSASAGIPLPPLLTAAGSNNLPGLTDFISRASQSEVAGAVARPAGQFADVNAPQTTFASSAPEPSESAPPVSWPSNTPVPPAPNNAAASIAGAPAPVFSSGAAAATPNVEFQFFPPAPQLLQAAAPQLLQAVQPLQTGTPLAQRSVSPSRGAMLLGDGSSQIGGVARSAQPQSTNPAILSDTGDLSVDADASRQDWFAQTTFGRTIAPSAPTSMPFSASAVPLAPAARTATMASAVCLPSGPAPDEATISFVRSPTAQVAGTTVLVRPASLLTAATMPWLRSVSDPTGSFARPAAAASTQATGAAAMLSIQIADDAAVSFVRPDNFAAAATPSFLRTASATATPPPSATVFEKQPASLTQSVSRSPTSSFPFMQTVDEPAAASAQPSSFPSSLRMPPAPTAAVTVTTPPPSLSSTIAISAAGNDTVLAAPMQASDGDWAVPKPQPIEEQAGATHAANLRPAVADLPIFRGQIDIAAAPTPSDDESPASGRAPRAALPAQDVQGAVPATPPARTDEPARTDQHAQSVEQQPVQTKIDEDASLTAQQSQSAEHPMQPISSDDAARTDQPTPSAAQQPVQPKIDATPMLRTAGSDSLTPPAPSAPVEGSPEVQPDRLAGSRNEPAGTNIATSERPSLPPSPDITPGMRAYHAPSDPAQANKPDTSNGSNAAAPQQAMDATPPRAGTGMPASAGSAMNQAFAAPGHPDQPATSSQASAPANPQIATPAAQQSSTAAKMAADAFDPDIPPPFDATPGPKSVPAQAPAKKDDDSADSDPAAAPRPWPQSQGSSDTPNAATNDSNSQASSQGTDGSKAAPAQSHATTAAQPATPTQAAQPVNAPQAPQPVTVPTAPANPALRPDITSQQPPGARANAPAATSDVANLAMRIAAKLKDGDHHFDIRLDPPELGRVDVRLSVDSTGHAEAHIVADNHQSLNVLQRDSGTLHQALKDSGLDVSNNSLNFSLKGQDRGDGGAQRYPTRPSAPVFSNEPADLPNLPPSIASNAPMARLDIRI